jgi:hypothetical protein
MFNRVTFFYSTALHSKTTNKRTNKQTNKQQIEPSHSKKSGKFRPPVRSCELRSFQKAVKQYKTSGYTSSINILVFDNSNRREFLFTRLSFVLAPMIFANFTTSSRLSSANAQISSQYSKRSRLLSRAT